MAYFRTKFQILSVTSLKENGHQSLMFKSPSIIQSMLTKSTRSFWSRKSDDLPIKHGVGNCGEPLPPRMDLVSKGCPSKCLDSKKPQKGWRCRFFNIRKQPVVNEKPSNCKKTKEVKVEAEEQLTWWGKIFGPDPKTPPSDPCTCESAHKGRKKMKEHDPRLCDPRYQQTKGDVLLYTEVIKMSKAPCLEPQPKPPPEYKVPKAVFFRKLNSDYNMTLLNRMADDHEMCEVKKDTHLETYRIPYEELRPPEKRRKSFSCKSGVQSKDVLPPMNTKLNSREILQHRHIHKPNSELLKYSQIHQNELCEDKSSLNQTDQKRSRIEQLKILIKQKNTTC